MIDVSIYPSSRGVYAIRNINNGKVYVGSSTNIRRRLYSHLWSLDKGVHRSKHLQNAYQKYGIVGFSFVVLDMWSDFPLAEVEQFYIDKYQSFSKENGYNTQPRAYSNRGNRLSEETKKKIGDFFRGKPKTGDQNLKNSLAHKGDKNINFGKPILPKLKEAIIENNIRGRMPIRFMNPDGEWIDAIGLAEFCRLFGLSCSAMSNVLNGKQSNHLGWKSEKSILLKQRKRKPNDITRSV